MIGVHFYNETIKTAVAVFGSMFNNIVIKRRDGKFLPVPISYGPRQKWLEAQKALDPTEEMFEKLLPRMSYELVAIVYDEQRKLANKQTMVRLPDETATPRQRINVPVPYKLSFTLYLTTKTLNDGWQIVEQILPFFTPSYTVKVRHFPADADHNTPMPTNAYDMPITLEAMTYSDDYTGDLSDRRLVEWSFEFTSKIWLHGPVAESTVIYDSRAIVSTPPEGVSLKTLNRGKEQEGNEVGYVQLSGSTDSDGILTNDSDANFANDSDISPAVLNLSDSDGNIIKIVRALP